MQAINPIDYVFNSLQVDETKLVSAADQNNGWERFYQETLRQFFVGYGIKATAEEHAFQDNRARCDIAINQAGYQQILLELKCCTKNETLKVFSDRAWADYRKLSNELKPAFANYQAWAVAIAPNYGDNSIRGLFAGWEYGEAGNFHVFWAQKDSIPYIG